MGEFSFIGEAALIGRAKAAITEAIHQSAEDFVGKAQAATPVDTGTLRASIHIESESATEATVATGGEASEYAIPVHEGWSAHLITAHGGGLFWPGASHPVKSVMNPGHAGFRYMSNPLLANRGLYLAAMARAAAGEF